MEATSALGAIAEPQRSETTVRSPSNLTTDDFFKLLITQISNQDPFEPTSNEELLQQISSIRNIELSTTLTESLRSLTDQQQFGTASSLIGQYVTGPAGDNGTNMQGVVVAVRFDAGGQPVLQLSTGAEVPIDQVSLVEAPLRAAERLIGQHVAGVDQRDPGSPQVLEGLVSAARVDESGEVVLELDSGQELRLRDFVAVTQAI